MVNITVPNLAGTLVLLFAFVAFVAPIKQAIQIALPHLSSVETFLILLIPAFMLLAIIANIFPENQPGGR